MILMSKMKITSLALAALSALIASSPVIFGQDLPVGSQCSEYQQCATYYCFEGRCTCHPYFDAGCEEGFVCARDRNFTCIELQQNLPVGSQCYRPQECATTYCSLSPVCANNTCGVCTCNPDTDTGCDEGFICLYNYTSYPTVLQCVKLGQDLPLGSQCYVDEECMTKACSDVKADGVCYCNDIDISLGCEEGFSCVDNDCRETCQGDGDCDEGQLCFELPLYMRETGKYCYELGDGEFGDSCSYDWDCAIGYCHIQPSAIPVAPSSKRCACNPAPNAAHGSCGFLQVCVTPVYLDIFNVPPPICMNYVFAAVNFVLSLLSQSVGLIIIFIIRAITFPRT